MKNQSRRFWLARTHAPPTIPLRVAPGDHSAIDPSAHTQGDSQKQTPREKEPPAAGVYLYIYVWSPRRRTIGQHVANGRGGHARRLSTQRHPFAPLSRETKRKTSSARKPPSLIVCDHCCNFVQIAECNSRFVNIKITHTQHSTPL
jgi:hypothetical protein